ncbi:PRC-barrel domain-containing protein [Frondihabitans australicus]|uniref:PRC-barrel domain protein n=1 Tax=Frondihabitans australicus TaxID=386892 RepID=A0A495IMW7_9MICO|nr:PRC-barrel domain-containing protein [Frondihabitans australicus]RKR76531.1 PRC-barrel domain protein [Frondihabitans australicus]
MFEAENLRDWIGESVLDQDGDKVGTLESVYFDTATDTPAFATVQAGLIDRKLLFVPLNDAVVGPKWLKVKYGKKLIKDAPSIPTDGELEAAAEPAVFEHYKLPYQTGSGGERRLGRR